MCTKSSLSLLRRIIYYRRKFTFLISFQFYIVLHQPSQTCHTYFHVCLLTEKSQVALVGPFQEKLFLQKNIQECARACQIRPTFMFSTQDSLSKAVRFNLPLLGQKSPDHKRKIHTWGTEMVFPLLSSIRHNTIPSPSPKLSRKGSWRIFFVNVLTHHTRLGLCACHLPLCPIPTWKKFAAVHHLLPSRY